MRNHQLIKKLSDINNQLIRAKKLAEKMSGCSECTHCGEMQKFFELAMAGINEIVELGDDIHRDSEPLIPIIKIGDEMKEKYQ